MPPKKTTTGAAVGTTTKKTSPSKSPSKSTTSTAKTGAVKKTATSTKKTATPSKAKPGAKTPAKTAPAEKAKKEEPVTVTEVAFKDAANVLLDDKGGQIKEAGRSPLVIDPTGNVATFLKYRDVKIIEAVDPTSLQPETLRTALLGAVRYGKILALDMKDTDMFATCTEKFEEIYKGLMDDVMSKDILKNEKYIQLVKETDGEQYQSKYDFRDDLMSNFQFMIITKIEPSSDLMKKTYPIRVIP